MLKGQAKTNYQRNYMRRRRLKGRLLDPSVRPIVDPQPDDIELRNDVPIEIDADGNVIPEEG